MACHQKIIALQEDGFIIQPDFKIPKVQMISDATCAIECFRQHIYGILGDLPWLPNQDTFKIAVAYRCAEGYGDRATAIKVAEWLKKEGFSPILLENTRNAATHGSFHTDLPHYQMNTVPEGTASIDCLLHLPSGLTQEVGQGINDLQRQGIYTPKTSSHSFQEPGFKIPGGGGGPGLGLANYESGLPPASQLLEEDQGLHRLEKQTLYEQLLKGKTEGNYKKSTHLAVAYQHIPVNAVRAILMIAAVHSDDLKDIDIVAHTWDNPQNPKARHVLMSYDPFPTVYERLCSPKAMALLKAMGVGSVEFCIEGQKSQPIYINETGKVLRILDYFPLTSKDLSRVLHESVPISGTTGINTFSETVSRNGLPIYETLWMNRDFYQEILGAAHYFDPDSEGLHAYFRGIEALCVEGGAIHNPDESLRYENFKPLADLARSETLQAQLSKFNEWIVKEKNIFRTIRGIINAQYLSSINPEINALMKCGKIPEGLDTPERLKAILLEAVMEANLKKDFELSHL